MPLSHPPGVAVCFAMPVGHDWFCRIRATRPAARNRPFPAWKALEVGIAAPFWTRRRRALRHIGAGVHQGRFTKETRIMESRIEDLVRRLMESIPPGVRGLQHDLESNFRAVLRANLARLDLVARDEFTAQTRVLERTRARLEELERRVAELEARTPP